jgi:hypothetical protein
MTAQGSRAGRRSSSPRWRARAYRHLADLRTLLHAALREAYTRAADPKAMGLLTVVAGLTKDLTISVNKKGTA